ncbi:MAG TPA: hypothetical protein VGE72_05365 [Azospirillum sp.]
MVSLTQTVAFCTRHPGTRGAWFHRVRADGAVVEVFVPAAPAKDNDAFCARRPWTEEGFVDEADPGRFLRCGGRRRLDGAAR